MQREPQKASTQLADPGVRRMLEDFVRRRVPASDVDDVVQTVLVDALASPSIPSDATELRKWLLGIARHKVVDHHRRAVREPVAEPGELAAHAPPFEERALADWAEKQAGSERDAQKTLSWMAREGEGEKLESIAAEENVPPTRVRQRVSRMRRWMKERWLAELAAVAALCALAILLWKLLRKPDEVPEARPEQPVPSPSAVPPEPSVLERARAMRDEAFRKCDQADYRGCLEGLDEALRLDPAGDTEPRVVEARDRANKALQTPPLPTPSAAPLPLPTAPTTPIQKSVKPAPQTPFTTSPGPTSTALPPPTSDGKTKTAPSKPLPNFGSKKSSGTISGSEFGDMKK